MEINTENVLAILAILVVAGILTRWAIDEADIHAAYREIRQRQCRRAGWHNLNRRNRLP